MHTSSKDFFKQNPEFAQRLNDCVQHLVHIFAPEKIILFGSFARGEIKPKQSGTMDIMVIAETDLRFFDRIKKALESCKGGDPPIEPLIYTPSEFDMLLSQGEGFIEDALEEGVVLYDKK